MGYITFTYFVLIPSLIRFLKQETEKKRLAEVDKGKEQLDKTNGSTVVDEPMEQIHTSQGFAMLFPTG